MTDLTEQEERVVPLAIRAWLEVGFTDREKRLLATGLLAVGILGGDVDQAMALAFKLGIGDLIEEQVKRAAELAEAARFPP